MWTKNWAERRMMIQQNWQILIVLLQYIKVSWKSYRQNYSSSLGKDWTLNWLTGRKTHELTVNHDLQPESHCVDHVLLEILLRAELSQTSTRSNTRKLLIYTQGHVNRLTLLSSRYTTYKNSGGVAVAQRSTVSGRDTDRQPVWSGLRLLVSKQLPSTMKSYHCSGA